MPYIHPDDDEMLYMDRDKQRVVKEGDPDAAFVLVGPGGTLPDEDAQKFGLTGEKAQGKAPANKAMDAPPANKAQVVRSGFEVEATDDAQELAQENGIDLRAVTGTGKGGRVLKGDVQRMIDGQED